MNSLHIPSSDSDLSALQRHTVVSESNPSAKYYLDRVLGAGGMSVAFFALRSTGAGAIPVVLKVTRPEVMAEMGDAGDLIVRKEAVALGRLNETVPPTPYVVRLVDAGALSVVFGERALSLPWLAVEYVHGGVEGTTLDERIRFSVEHTGFAFDPTRAARAIECIANGLDAVHGVGVVHRDVSPYNILCCGFAQDEIFKVADFGIARPHGTDGTFGGVPVGTPGYASPEQAVLDDARIGPASDVFAFAAVIYRLLTGDDYFPANTVVEGVAAAHAANRRALSDGRYLAPELRQRPSALAAIDRVLARATAPDSRDRPPTAGTLAALLLPHLRPGGPTSRVSVRHLRSIARAPTLLSGWTWTVRHQPGDERAIRSVAWDGDGTCVAATSTGLEFWDGSSWKEVDLADSSMRRSLRLVHRLGGGRWLLGGDEATLAELTADGVGEVVRGPDPTLSFTHASGAPDDLAMLVGARADGSPLLCAMAAGRWAKPAALVKAKSVLGLARIADDRWLVVGRSTRGDGFAITYAPLLWDLERVKTPPARAYLACAGQPDLGLGLVVGAEGRAIRLTSSERIESAVDGSPDLSAASIDPSGRAWAASVGSIWLQPADRPERWSGVWHDPSWTVPFVSIFSDLGRVIAITADGGLVEGRG